MRTVSLSIALPTMSDVRDMGNTLRSASARGLAAASKKMAPKPARKPKKKTSKK